MDTQISLCVGRGARARQPIACHDVRRQAYDDALS